MTDHYPPHVPVEQPMHGSPMQRPPTAAPQHPPLDASIDDWSASQELSRQVQRSGGLFRSLTQDGERVDLMMVQRPYGYPAHRRQGAGGRPFSRCVGRPEGCDECRTSGRPTTRYLLDVLTLDDQQQHAMEISETTYRLLHDLVSEAPPSQHVYGLSRHGRPRDTTTTYAVRIRGPIAPALLALRRQVQPLDLEALSWGSRPPRRANGSGGTCAPVPDAPF